MLQDSPRENHLYPGSPGPPGPGPYCPGSPGLLSWSRRLTWRSKSSCDHHRSVPSQKADAKLWHFARWASIIQRILNSHPRPSAIVALAPGATRDTSGISSTTWDKITSVIAEVLDSVFCDFHPATNGMMMIFTSWTSGTASTTWPYSAGPSSLVTLDSI